MYSTKRRTILNISCLILFLVYAGQSPTASAQGAPVVARAVGILRNLIKIGGGVAADQAVKTATEEAVKQGVPLPAEQYDLTATRSFYNEHSYGTYAFNQWPDYDLTVWLDANSQQQYSLQMNGAVVSTAPVYFEEAKRSYHCTPSLGNDWNLTTTIKYLGRCVVTVPNIAHAVYTHPAKMFWAGPRLLQDCLSAAPNVYESAEAQAIIGRGSASRFEVTGNNYQIAYSYISYQ